MEAKLKSISCDIITKTEVTKNILKTEKRCFECLKQGHLVSACGSNFKCFKCDGNHHITVCTFKPTKKEDTDDSGNQLNQNANNYASSSFQLFKNGSILLQTVRADVFSPDEKETKNIRILDNGSQLNYVSPKACRELKLSPIDKKEISIRTFGKHVKSATH